MNKMRLFGMAEAFRTSLGSTLAENMTPDAFLSIIESLNPQRLIELQKYVKSCYKSAGDSIPTRYVEEFKKNKRESSDENLETI